LIKDPASFIGFVIVIIVVVFKALRINASQQVKQNLYKLKSYFKARSNFKLRAPKDRLYKISYVLITLSGVFLIHAEEQSGIINGDENDKEWVAKRSLRKKNFENPITFVKKIPPLFSEITDKVKKSIPIYPVVVFNNRTKISDITSSDVPVIKAKDLLDYINSFEKDVLEKTDVNVLYDQLKEYRFDF